MGVSVLVNVLGILPFKRIAGDLAQLDGIRAKDDFGGQEATQLWPMTQFINRFEVH
jgi:hypothetical protein